MTSELRLDTEVVSDTSVLAAVELAYARDCSQNGLAALSVIAQPGPTTFGTSGPDVMFGTEGPDRIAGLGGDDVIFGLAGTMRWLVGRSIPDPPSSLPARDECGVTRDHLAHTRLARRRSGEHAQDSH